MAKFLEQLIQSGGLAIPSPMKAYKNILATKAMETNIRSAKLDQEGKLADITKGYLQRITGLEDYRSLKKYLAEKHGEGFRKLPDFETDKELKEWIPSAIASADALLKQRQGKSFKMHNRVTGATAEFKSIEDLEQKHEAGVLDKDKWDYGDKGWKPAEDPEAKLRRAEQLERTKAALKEGKGADKADRIWVTKDNRKKQVRQYSKEHLDAIKGGWAEGQPISTARPPAGQTYRLSDGTRVRSFDGGRTYTDETGKSRPLPTDAFPMEVEITMQDIRMEEAQKEAVRKMGAVQERAELPTAEEAARGGTGPFAKVAAAIDAVAGGLNIDLIFGKEGLFQDTQENRQLLRTIKQMGKSALMNSSRGAIWEQEKIDKLFPDPDKTWRNPRTEARKFIVLRETLLTERNFNLEAIASAVSPKEVDKLRGSNLEIDRLLALIKPAEETGAGSSGLTPEDEALINKYLRQ